MSEADDADEKGSTAATDAFSLLADETRLAIVETLVERGFGNDDLPMGFAELRRAVGVEDAGQFNYHLRKLRPQFVEKNENGYSPRFGALGAVGAARAGTLTDRPAERRAELETTCPRCDGSLDATHEGSHVRVECPEHGLMFQTAVSPRVARTRSVPEVVRYAWREVGRDIERMREGACMVCAGPVEHEVPAGVEPDAEDEPLYVRFACTLCGFRMQIPLGVLLLDHPAVIAHYHARGIDVRNEVLFVPTIDDDTATTVVSQDPFEARITLPVEGDDLALRINADLDVGMY